MAAETLCITPEDRETVQRNIERHGELLSYLLENPAEAEQLNGATVVFDEGSFEYEKGKGGKVIFAERFFRFSHSG
ncbi:MAG: hypothetical protein LBC70_07695 [Chitinispirillales bacterium]|jgi:hypothetical protein|nr:hypothetical protein [Chitinispirillales bacterium]